MNSELHVDGPVRPGPAFTEWAAVMLSASGAIRIKDLLKLGGPFASPRSTAPATPRILQVSGLHRRPFARLVRELAWQQAAFIETRIGPLLAASHCSPPVVAQAEILLVARRGLSALIPAHTLDDAPDGVAGSVLPNQHRPSTIWHEHGEGPP